jgi:NAD(P)-dependent dehydrogenase (short-subunit alcohol dehydrogenase family)
MRKVLSGRVVVVMGASSGIGRLTALEFARHGARVVVSARSDESLDALAAELRERGTESLALPADTADPAQVRAVAEEAARTFGALDVWVQMAAVAVYAPFDQTSAEEFRDVIAVDLLGQAYGAMAALPIMKRQGRGHLIHVSSVEAEVPIPYHSAYGAAKHGVAGMLDVVRLELKEAGTPISVTNVMPASIDTPFFDHARTKLGVAPQGIPPIYDPMKVARAIVRSVGRPRRRVIVGGAGQVMVRMHRHFPRLTEAVLRRTAFRAQKTRRQKALGAGDNLAGPSQDDRIRRSNGAHRPGRRALRMGAAALTTVALVGVARAVVRRLAAS